MTNSGNVFVSGEALPAIGPGMVAQPRGNMVAQPRGNMVAQPRGNMVANHRSLFTGNASPTTLRGR